MLEVQQALSSCICVVVPLPCMALASASALCNGDTDLYLSTPETGIRTSAVGPVAVHGMLCADMLSPIEYGILFPSLDSCLALSHVSVWYRSRNSGVLTAPIAELHPTYSSSGWNSIRLAKDCSRSTETSCNRAEQRPWRGHKAAYWVVKNAP